MSNKDVFNDSEIIQPMGKPDFDYKKHYPKLMENYCKALSIIESLERENAELEEHLSRLAKGVSIYTPAEGPVIWSIHITREEGVFLRRRFDDDYPDNYLVD